MATHFTIVKSALAAVAALSLMTAHAAGFSNNEVRLGVLTDLSGPQAGFAGIGSVTAVKMAVEDFGGSVNGHPISVISGDHLNKTDVAAATAREWYDRGGIDAIFDVTNSSATLAVMGVTQQKNRIVMIGGSSTTKVTTDACTPNSVQYIYDANALSNITGRALIKQGFKTWYFITVDYAFGIGLQKATTAVVETAGGKVIGSVRSPLNTTDFSSYILQAQASGAQVIALALAGTDLTNAIKTANEFHVYPKQTVASLLTFISDVHAMGLKQAQGTTLTAPFYWDLNDETRKWSKRFYKKTGTMPGMVHAGMYSAALHYLNAVKAVNTDTTEQVMAKMKATPINDLYTSNGKIREDGLLVHDMYLFRVKTPEESKYPWDYYKVVTKVPAAEAFSPMVPGACRFVKAA